MKSEIAKELIKFGVAGVLAAIVYVGGVNFVLLPQINGLSSDVKRLTGIITGQELQLNDNIKKIDTLNRQVGDWEKGVGVLLSDQKLTSDLRAALQTLQSLSPDKRDFLAASGRLSKAIRIDSDGALRLGFGKFIGPDYEWELQLSPVKSGVFTPGTLYVIHRNDDGSYKDSWVVALNK